MMEIVRKPVIKPEEFRLISEFVAETFGLSLDADKEGYLTARISPRLRDLGLTTFAEYYNHLKFAPSAEERLRFISLITNNETYFFREQSQLQVFAETVIPALRDRKLRNGDRKIRIVSAGCSSGEEVYTLAMLILESGNFIWNWDLSITGIDIDPQAIEKAKAGVYNGRVFQSTPGQYLERYFRTSADGLQVRENIRSMTSFVQGNLLNLDTIFSEQEVDIIFCRNALIYFSAETMRRAIEGFAGVLTRDGLLFLGHSESLSRITNLFRPLHFPGAIIYEVRDDY